MRNPFTYRKPPRKKLAYPFPVSQGMRGLNLKATKAFVRPSKNIKERIRGYAAWKNKSSRDSNPDASGYRAAAGLLGDELHAIASSSDFFIKPESKRIKLIREKMIRAGIHVETPLEDLKNGTALFARTKWKDVLAIIQERIRRKPAFYQRMIDSAIQLLIRVHKLNIVHTHFHRRNVVFDKEGNPELIDLSQARLYKNPVSSKNEFLRRNAADIRAMTEIVSNLTERIHPNTDYNYRYFTEQIMNEYCKHLPTFGATAVEVLEFRG